MEKLKVSIKPKYEPSKGQCLLSSGYSIVVNNRELGRGVTDFKLEIPAGQKPKDTLTFTPDILDVDEMTAIKKAQIKNNLVGKYLEISGEIAGRIEQENKKDLLVRRAIVIHDNIYRGDEQIDGIVSDIGLCEQAVYVDKKVLDSYWVKVVELSTVPETINSIDSTELIRKWLNM